VKKIGGVLDTAALVDERDRAYFDRRGRDEDKLSWAWR